jgi:hypothetical protein
MVAGMVAQAPQAPRSQWNLPRSCQQNLPFTICRRQGSQTTATAGTSSFSRKFAFRSPLEQQRRIVDILSHAASIRRLRGQAKAMAKELIPALFLDMFGDPATNPKGWPTARVGNLAEKISDGPFGSNLKTAHYTSAGVRVFRLQNIGVGFLLDDDQVFVSEKHFSNLQKHECLPGDVIIGTLGDPEFARHRTTSFNRAGYEQG